MQADELELSIERAVPLGLILNEIATNSIKHAFGSEGGETRQTSRGRRLRRGSLDRGRQR